MEPPRPVVVELRHLWPPERGVRWARDTPIWVRASGVDLHEDVEGTLTHWLLTCAGDWLGVVEGLQLGSQNNELSLPLGPQVVRASTIRPR
ncbi:hypothetical protein FB384_004931 [Prauserella sediminis]|uniref:Uncharacterized protein n=1 Tax=Prauserella sediminis TaxID=577680 RepID=A0A839XQ79_9PSEU|nr:hypothetical protein [Prauserella sediminis]MBB3665972.1 hypothetical protein [Prauserella sediminis]